MSESVLCVDLGTTQIKVAAVDPGGRLLHLTAAATPGGPSGQGLFGVDPLGCVARVEELCGRVAAQLTPAETPAALCVTNQRATLVALDADEHPLAALSWQDMRCAGAVQRFAARLDPGRFQQLTGLPLGPLYSLGKLLWLQETHPGVLQRARRLVLLHDLLLRRLGAPDYVTDPSNASATGLLELSAGRWSEEIARAAGLDLDLLPRLVPAGALAGRLSAGAAGRCGLPEGLPLVVGGGDQQCAVLGMGVLRPESAGLSLGTAAVLCRPLDRRPQLPPPGFLFTSHLARSSRQPVSGAVDPGALRPERVLQEGFCSSFGSALEWAATLTRLPPAELVPVQEPLQGEPPLFLPFLNGIGSPEHDGEVRGGLLGLDLEHRPMVVAQAMVLGLGLELRRLLEASGEGESTDALPPLQRVVVSGGPSVSPAVHQALAAALGPGRQLSRHPSSELTLLGAACLAWTALERFDTLEEASRRLGGVAEPLALPPEHPWDVERQYQRYCRAVALIRQVR